VVEAEVEEATVVGRCSYTTCRWVSLNLHIEKTFRSLLISYGRKVCGISATRGGLVMADLVR
jgi:hypothetical protein